MKIYLDLYFLINYILDLALLIGTGKLLKKEVKIKNYLLGSLMGSTSIFLLFIKLNSINLFITKIIISGLMILVTFGHRDFKNNIMYFYVLSIILGGTFYLFDINFDYSNKSYYLNYLILLIFSPIIIYIFIKDYLVKRRMNSCKLKVEIIYKEEIFKTYGIIDTGNHLKDPYKKRDVILVDYNFIIEEEKQILVPFKALNSSGLVKCFVPDKIIVNDNIVDNCLIGISNDSLNLSGCRCILPNTMMEGIE